MAPDQTRQYPADDTARCAARPAHRLARSHSAPSRRRRTPSRWAKRCTAEMPRLCSSGDRTRLYTAKPARSTAARRLIPLSGTRTVLSQRGFDGAEDLRDLRIQLPGSISSTVRRGCRMTSTGKVSVPICRRTHSRSLRLMRLRSTAFSKDFADRKTNPSTGRITATIFRTKGEKERHLLGELLARGTCRHAGNPRGFLSRQQRIGCFGWHTTSQGFPSPLYPASPASTPKERRESRAAASEAPPSPPHPPARRRHRPHTGPLQHPPSSATDSRVQAGHTSSRPARTSIPARARSEHGALSKSSEPAALFR